MLETENVYGMRKRLLFVQEVIEQCKPKRVLDVGCGTGDYLTTPLAQQFPDSYFIAIDSDTASIEYAKRQNQLPNLIFMYPNEVVTDESFDVVIASEVIEHVEHPGEFLRYLRGFLHEEGKIILTTPNGYGPFELASLLEAILHISGIRRGAQHIKHMLARSHKTITPPVDTLAISPHLNFFSFKELGGLFGQAGLRVVRARSRTFLCGYLLDWILRGQIILDWNARVADILPYRLNSDWMFDLEKIDTLDPVIAPYKRNPYARFRKRLSLKRWGLQP